MAAGIKNQFEFYVLESIAQESNESLLC